MLEIMRSFSSAAWNANGADEFEPRFASGWNMTDCGHP